MEESLLREILAVQKDILAELRLVRQALALRRKQAASAPTRQTPAVAPTAPPVPEVDAVVPPAQAAQPAPDPQPAPVAPAAPQPAAPAPTAQTPPPQAQTPPQQPKTAPPAGSMLTLDELTDLGGQFLEPGQLSRGNKVAPVEAADLLRDIKAKNRAKRSAFAEFDKFGRGR